jgi:peptidoglycan/LPS O-acetylase OafA/YrhL
MNSNLPRQIVHRDDIQVIRGIAVVSVVLFHTSKNIFPNGFLGVDAFFVISGFVMAPLIAGILEQNSTRLKFVAYKKFIIKRFFRLAPALTVTLLCTSAVILFFARISDVAKFSRQGIFSTLGVGNFGAYKYQPDYFSPQENILVHTWSLSTEVQFYIVIPLLAIVLGIATKNSRNFLNFAIASGTIFSVLLTQNLAVAASVYGKLGISDIESASFYLILGRIWEFFIGIIFFHLKFRIRKLALPSAIILFTILICPADVESQFSVPLVVISTGIVLSEGIFRATPNSFSKIFLWIGDRSYSIYLVHFPILYISLQSPLFQSLNVPKYQLILLAYLMIFALGNLQYRKIENRFRFAKSQEPKTSRDYRKLILLSVTPLFAFSFLLVGSANKFWGLDRSEERPQYAADLDTNCARDSINGPPCKYTSDLLNKTVLLIGDSRAGHLSQAVVDAASEIGFNSIIWTHSSCNFNLFEGVPDWCKNANHQILAFLKSNRPEVVILSQLTPLNVSNSSYVKSLELLKENSKKLFFVEETPRFTDHEFFNPGSLFQKHYSPDKYMYLDVRETNYFKNSQRLYKNPKLNGTETIDLNHVLCPENVCIRWKSGEWLYRDIIHLSVDGADLTTQTFVDILASES